MQHQQNTGAVGATYQANPAAPARTALLQGPSIPSLPDAPLLDHNQGDASPGLLTLTLFACRLQRRIARAEAKRRALFWWCLVASILDAVHTRAHGEGVRPW